MRRMAHKPSMKQRGGIQLDLLNFVAFGKVTELFRVRPLEVARAVCQEVLGDREMAFSDCVIERRVSVPLQSIVSCMDRSRLSARQAVIWLRLGIFRGTQEHILHTCLRHAHLHRAAQRIARQASGYCTQQREASFAHRSRARSEAAQFTNRASQGRNPSNLANSTEKECLSSVKRHLHRVKPAERSSKAQMDDIVHESSFERLDNLRQADRNVHTTAERRRAPC